MTATPNAPTTYTVTARDGNGCSSTATKTVEVYTLPTVSIADVADACPNVGFVAFSATANLANADHPSFTYAWTCDNENVTITPNGTEARLNNIPSTCQATTYTVHVTVTETSHNCTATASNTVTVKDDENPTITPDTNVITAVGNTAVGNECRYTMPNLTEAIQYTLSDNNCTSLDVLRSSLTQNFEYRREISETTPVTVTVTDACNNTASTVITVEVPGVFAIDEDRRSHVNVTCPGGHDGKLAIDVDHITDGGIPPFTYTIDNGEYGNEYVFDGLAAGDHVLSAKDANGCTSSKTVTITEPDTFKVVINTRLATCANNNGEVRVVVSGGTPSDVYGYVFQYIGIGFSASSQAKRTSAIH